MDTTNSTIKGKAYEYACIIALEEIVSPIRPINIVNNLSLGVAKERYLKDIDDSERSIMLASAKAGIATIIEMEPKIIEDGTDAISISIQPDWVAREGDVRDVLIIRKSIDWEIGISVKHNHEALKHSRLSTNLDFGNSWFGIPSTKTYFEEIKPIFSVLEKLKSENALWRDMTEKEDVIYIPLLEAFQRELIKLVEENSEEVTAGLIKYLLGSNGNDYYKLIHYNKHITRVIPYNLYGTLNNPSPTSKPKKTINHIELPTRFIDLSRKEGSKTTVILTMDKGWAISFRIHNASSRVEASLKFDIQLIGQPSGLFYIDASW